MAQQRNLPTTLDDSNQVSNICSAVQPSGMNTVVSTTSSSHGGLSLQVSQQPAAALGLGGLSVPPAYQHSIGLGK